MLAANSDREKMTITIKKSNKALLEFLAEKDNRNVSRQVDFIVDYYRMQAERKIIDMLGDVDKSIELGEKWLTGKELLNKLGIQNEL